ncbi:MAG: isocitrate/isopropylmalate dehydrogenase family protein [Chloroflexi bacterium AL-W]|nr:isocitrate/isopropylmalate dehydrogenase family protein [Chloroflexi bacterium AL-N1]NOK65077.1 isocitrate/isopropylmalate dehydrogenase family protein [Chloroflexi bacterium AL-N10]NOK72656.1 isocitrate/isopropylmalate dehydrogenase family protein [Chloroflexi bacterium AL-N5]NOK79256.1 isocitrate/isopropylmalate dehydrogenase family protein [Chloroflexi bacterium AL-W]NOK87172.1 isocitrate/isopropylmalate dehydrogenase family protein [Chloroflexi bacterium AL-N15]
MSLSSNHTTLRVLVLPGDGIGPEVIPAAVAVLQATGLPFVFTEAEAGWACFERHGISLPNETVDTAHQSDAILFGAVASPSYAVIGYSSPIVALRRELDLYANIRPVRSLPLPIRQQSGNWTDSQRQLLPERQIDLVVVRENTEGLYSGQESSNNEIAVARRIITRQASERIVRTACQLAHHRSTTHERQVGLNTASQPAQRIPQVTIVHKANVLRETCGLFRTAALAVAEEFPAITVDELLVDNAALQLVQRPERYDVIVTTNMFGDILSDIASFWGGGLGMASSANLGKQHALFEPVHGAAPDIVGQGIANPLAAIGCAAMLLEHLGQQSSDSTMAEDCGTWASRIRTAINTTVIEGPNTPDLGGTARTEDVTDAIITALN